VNEIFSSQVHESDTGPDRTWSDPTIRRNPIGILQDTIGFRRIQMGSDGFCIGSDRIRCQIHGPGLRKMSSLQLLVAQDLVW